MQPCMLTPLTPVHLPSPVTYNALNESIRGARGPAPSLLLIGFGRQSCPGVNEMQPFKDRPSYDQVAAFKQS